MSCVDRSSRAHSRIGAGQPRTVAEGVPDCHVLGQVRVWQAEPGQVGRHRLVPPHLALVDEHRDGHRRQRLGRRHHTEQCLRVDRAGLAEAAHPEALLVHRGTVLDHDNRQPGDLPVLPPLGDEGVERGIGCLQVRGRGGGLGLGRCRNGQDDPRQDGRHRRSEALHETSRVRRQGPGGSPGRLIIQGVSAPAQRGASSAARSGRAGTTGRWSSLIGPT